MVTLKDIAREAGVSITTVSNVVHKRKSRVSPELVDKIWKIIEREHYAPSMSARSLAQERSSIIGVITHLTPQNTGSTLGDPFLSTFVDSIEKRTREAGYYLMIRAVEDARELAALSHSWQLSGLILTGMFQDDFFLTTKEIGIPFVLIDSYVDDPEACCVGLEDEEGSRMATRHLLENGHRTVAFASPAIRPGGVIDMRLRGYRRALEEYGIAWDPGLVFTQEITVEEGKKLGHTLAGMRGITGIVASADILAAGIMAGLNERGIRVPEDKSVVGFDDNYLAQLTLPALTTVHQDAEKKGVLATDMLLKQIRHEPVPQRSVILPVRLVERGSVRRL
ncbi:MAG: LacI family DNA-binding transcriptional regulator [Clostridia bacterium]|nr:LacI family DNA-binding transcriptional regulator [Clostridia bacterium]